MQVTKIAYLISQYPAVSHTFIEREIRFLRKQGFEIQIASINAFEMEESEVFYIKKTAFYKLIPAIFMALFAYPLGFLRGLKTALTSGGWDLKLHLYWLFYFLEALIVGHWLHKNEINHLHVHFANPASNVGLLVSKIYPVTFSMTVHGPDEFYDVTLNALEAKIATAHFILCISHYARSQLMRLSPVSLWDKFEIAPLGVDTALYSPTSKMENPIPIILCVGRLTPTKGQHILISAFGKVIKDTPAKLILVGNGPSRKELERMVKEKHLAEAVEFTGALNPEATLNFYKKADIFALTSFAEGLPVVLMEAMAMEIPCIASGINGIPELIHDQTNGFLVPPSDEEALVKVLEKLLKDSSLRASIGHAARQKALEAYSLEANSQRLAQIFATRLENSPYAKEGSQPVPG